MTKIEQMLAELCPNGVEWKELGEVAQIINGFAFKSSRYSESGIRVIRISDVQKGKLSNKDIRFYPLETKNEIKQWLLNENDLVVSLTGNVGRVAMIPKKALPAALNQRVACIRTSEDVLIRYLFHYLDQFSFEQEAIQNSSGGGQKNLSSAWLAKYKIPIPPLKIQEEIVQILDKFTEYVTELTSELTSRKKQYSYYRDKLLSFEDEVYQVEWKTLAAVSEITSNISWNKIGDDEKFKYIDLSSVDRVSNKIIETTSITKLTAPSRAQKIVKSDDIILGTTRPTLKRFTKITDDYNDQICSTGFYVFRTNGEVLPNYVYHIFSSTDFYKYLEENQSGASYPAISDALVKKYKIPVPSLEIQSRIIQVLDNFDMVCNDLNIGLPKEIELRQKQYEYFREKLLTFVAEGDYTDSTVQYRQDIIRLLTWVFGPIRVKVGQVVNLQRGKRLVRKQLTTSGSVPVYQNSLTPLGYYSESNRVKNTSFVICAGAAGEIGYSATDFWAADDVYTLETSDNISDKFMYYVLLSRQDRLKSQVRKASIPRLSKDAIDKVGFYLPSLTEQERIVSILDNFNTLTTSLSEGLPKEIELRQTQYEYWREQLLKF